MTNYIATPTSVQVKKIKPQNVIRFNPDTGFIPSWLKEAPRWCLWKVEPRPKDGKPIKVPKQCNGRNFHSDRPKERCSFNEAVEAFRAKPELFDGIGFMLGDGYAGFDLDSVLHDGAMSAEAAALLAHLQPRSNVWIETSPSGVGVKAFFRIKSTDEVKNLKGEKFKLPFDQEAELYSGGRYFTMTGHGYGALNDHSQSEGAEPYEAEVFISLHGELAAIHKTLQAKPERERARMIHKKRDIKESTLCTEY